MITKDKLYTKLTTLFPTIDVFHQSDNENDNTFWSKFPMITYKRIAVKRPKATERAEFYQITIRNTKAIDCEKDCQEIMSKLHQSTDTRYKSLRLFEDTVDLYDTETKAYGIAMTYLLVTQDPIFV